MFIGISSESRICHAERIFAAKGRGLRHCQMCWFSQSLHFIDFTCFVYYSARSNMTQAEMEDMRYWYDYVDKGNEESKLLVLHTVKFRILSNPEYNPLRI